MPAFLDVKFRFKSVAMEVELSVDPVVRKTKLVDVATSIPTAALLETTLNEFVDAVVVLVAIGIEPVFKTATALKLVGKAVIPLKFWL